MKDYFLLGKLTENKVLNYSIVFLYYLLMAIVVLSILPSISVSGEAQGVFVLIPLMMYGFIALPFLIVVRIIVRIKKISVTDSFKKITNTIFVVWFIANYFLLGIVS